MVPDESNVINEEIKTAITKLKETKEKRWSIIKQKFFEKYENCGEAEEEDGFEKYLAIEQTLPAKRVNLVTTNKSDRGAWIEQEFIAPELKPYHEEAERLRYDIEDKIKTLNLMVISNNPTESDPIETEKQDSATPEPTPIDTDTCSSLVMGSPKKQVKKKTKKTVASTSKGKKTLKPGNSNPKSLLLEDSSASEKKGSKRYVQDEELELALNKLQENKMRRWAMIKQKFFEKYEKVSENSKECGGTGHRNYEALGQEANLAYVSDDVVEYHHEANKLRDFIEGKVLTLKPYQAKLKNKKKAQENKECAEETMEKIIKTTLQFQKKCSLNGDPIVSNLLAKSPTTSVEKDKSVAMETVPSPSKSPKSNHRNSNGTNSPSPKKAVVKPNSSKLQKSQKIKQLPCKKNSRPSTSSFSDKHDMNQLSSESIEMTASDSMSDITSTSVENSSKVGSAVKKQKYKRRKDQIASESVDIPASEVRSDFKETSSSVDKQKSKDLDRKSLTWKEDGSPDVKSFSFKDKRNVDVLISPNPFRKRFQKHQSIKSSKTIINSKEMAKLDSESVLDESSSNDDLNSFSPASNKIQTVPVDQLPFKPLSSRNQTVQSKEVSPSDLDMFAVSGSSEFENESGSDKRSGLFHNPSPTKHQSFRASPKIKKLYLQRHSGCSPSSFCDEQYKDPLSSASDSLSDLASTSDKNSLKLSSSAVKKRKSKPSEDQIESVDASESDYPLDSTPIMSNFIESPSALKKRKYKDWRKENSPFQKTIRLSRLLESPILCNVPVDVLVRPSPEQDL